MASAPPPYAPADPNAGTYPPPRAPDIPYPTGQEGYQQAPYPQPGYAPQPGYPPQGGAPYPPQQGYPPQGYAPPPQGYPPQGSYPPPAGYQGQYPPPQTIPTGARGGPSNVGKLQQKPSILFINLKV